MAIIMFKVLFVGHVMAIRMLYFVAVVVSSMMV